MGEGICFAEGKRKSVCIKLSPFEKAQGDNWVLTIFQIFKLITF